MLIKLLLWLSYYIFLYPLAMSLIWIVSASYFYWRREKGINKPPAIAFQPFVSIITPFLTKRSI